jgi:hypothetical protein
MLGIVYSQKSLLACADCMMTLASQNQPIGDEFLSERDVVSSDPWG